MEKIDRWSFGINNDKLIELVLNGEKTATTYLYNEYQKFPKVGDISIITYDNGNGACMIETIDVIITEFKNITKDLAYLEGEGDKSLKYYRKSHIDYLKTIDKDFNDDTKVVFEIFKVLKKY